MFLIYHFCTAYRLTVPVYLQFWIYIARHKSPQVLRAEARVRGEITSAKIERTLRLVKPGYRVTDHTCRGRLARFQKRRSTGTGPGTDRNHIYRAVLIPIPHSRRSKSAALFIALVFYADRPFYLLNPFYQHPIFQQSASLHYL